MSKTINCNEQGQLSLPLGNMQISATHTGVHWQNTENNLGNALEWQGCLSSDRQTIKHRKGNLVMTASAT